MWCANRILPTKLLTCSVFASQLFVVACFLLPGNSLCTVALVSRGAFTADGYDVKIVTPVYGHLPGHVVYIQGEREMA